MGEDKVLQPKHKTFVKHLITGAITLLPLWLSLSIIWLIFRWVSGVFIPVLAPIFHAFFGIEESRFLVRLVSFIFTLFLITLIGVVTTDMVGRKILTRIENIILKLPLLRDIYFAMRKLTSQIFEHRRAFKRVVLVEYPRKGVYSLGFVTSTVFAELQRKTIENVVNIFIPSTPNPTTGFLLMVPDTDLTELEISVDDAIKLIMTGGIVTPTGDKKQFPVDEIEDRNERIEVREQSSRTVAQ